jgi:hypothetical protein
MIAPPARVKLAHQLEPALSISMSPAPRLAINFDTWTFSTGICMHLPDALPTSSAKGVSKSRHPLPASSAITPSSLLHKHLKLRPDQSRISTPLHLAEIQSVSAGKWPSSVLLEGSKPLRHTPVSRRRWLSRRHLFLIAQHQLHQKRQRQADYCATRRQFMQDRVALAIASFELSRERKASRKLLAYFSV